MTATVDTGDRVRVAYTGRFQSGEPFATSDETIATEHDLWPAETAEKSLDPLSFTVGAGEVIPGVEEAVVGMAVGESATVEVPPADAYGAYDPDRVREYDPETFEAMVGQPPEIGLHVEAQNGLHGDVTAVAETVEVDFNHELAGQTLIFELRVLDIA